MTNSPSNRLYESFLSELFPTPEESSRCQHALTKLAGQMREPPLLTGGLAIRWHLLTHGVRLQRRPFNDIDVVIDDESQLRESLSQHFQIAHYHPTRGRGKILMQLADEETRSRLDLVTPYSRSLTDRARTLTMAETSFGVVAAEDLVARLLCILSRLVQGQPVAPKYYEAFQRLVGLADLDSVAAIWHEYKDEWHPGDLFVAMTRVHQAVAENAHLLQPEVSSQAVDQICPWCRDSNVFPLAPAVRIHEIWGYV